MKQTYLISILLSIFLVYSLSLAETVELPNEGGKIELDSAAVGTTVVRVHGSVFSNTTRVDSIIIDNPARAVFDFVPAASRLKANLKFSLSENALFHSLRIGTSEKRTRFVLDFIDLKSKGYKISHLKETNEVIVTITNDATPVATETVPIPTSTPTPIETASATPISTPEPTPSATPSPTNTQEPTATPTVSPTPSPTPTSTPELTPSATPTPSPTPTATPSPTPTSTPEPTAMPTVSPTPSPTPTSPKNTKNGLKTIFFDSTSNSLQLQFINPVNYQLTRSSPESYLLLLEGALALQEDSILDQFPPQGILGFQAISPKTVEKGIQIEIFLEEDYQPEASWNKNTLVIKAKLQS